MELIHYLKANNYSDINKKNRCNNSQDNIINISNKEFAINISDFYQLSIDIQQKQDKYDLFEILSILTMNYKKTVTYINMLCRERYLTIPEKFKDLYLHVSMNSLICDYVPSNLLIFTVPFHIAKTINYLQKYLTDDYYNYVSVILNKFIENTENSKVDIYYVKLLNINNDNIISIN